MEKRIILSVCIPTYNRVGSLKKLLEIIAHQYNESIEVIVSDNNSQDQTMVFLADFEKKNPWIKVNHNETNIGIDNNLRKLFSLSSGQYVLFLGDDDYIQKGFVFSLLSILNSEPYGLVHFNACRVDAGGHYYLQKKKNLKRYENTRHRCSEKEICSILSEELADFMFMSINVYSKALLEQCISNSDEICSNVLWSLHGLLNGDFYYSSNLLVDGGTNISWRDSLYDVWFRMVPEVLRKATGFGISNNSINRIVEHHTEKCLASCFKRMIGNPNERKKILEKAGKLSIRMYCGMFYYLIKGFFFKNKRNPIDYTALFENSN